uniref:Nucleoprotein n=1 Tax=North Fork virus TaxID=3139876 RepID=A0AAN0LIQ5_9VIRU
MATLEALTARLKRTDLLVPTAGGTEITTWSDKLLLDEVKELKFGAPTESDITSTYQLFLTKLCHPEMYCSDLHALIVRTASLATYPSDMSKRLFADYLIGPPNNKFSWEAIQVKAQDLWTSIAEAGATEKPKEKPALPETTALTQVMEEAGSDGEEADADDDTDPGEGTSKEKKKGGLDSVTVHPFLSKAISLGKATQEEIRESRAILSFIALFFTRSTVKASTTMKTYWDTKLHGQIESIFGIKAEWSLPALPKQFFEVLEAKIKKGAGLVTYLHKACLALLYNLSTAPQTEETKAGIALLRASCLTHLNGNGLTLMGMIYDATRLLHKPMNKLLMESLCEQTSESVLRVLEFNEKVVGIEKASLLWAWCRYVDDSQYLSLGVKHNLFLACLMAAVRETLIEDQSSIWDMVDLQKAPVSFKEYAKQWATAQAANVTEITGKLSDEMQAVMNQGAALTSDGGAWETIAKGKA